MELIKITEQNGKQAVSARELHVFLESKQDFSTWIKNRIEKYGFIENQDFEVFHNFMENPNGGRPLIEYALTIDCAKEISMVEGNEKGKQARRYFIECERVAKNPVTTLTKIDLARMVIESEEENQRLQLEIKENEHKVIFTNAVVGSASSCLIGELAKVISQNGCTIGQNRLFEWLRDNGYLGKNGERKNIHNQQYIEQGLFEIKKGVRTGSDGVLHQTTTPKVTGKGQVYFVNKFLSNDKNLA